MQTNTNYIEAKDVLEATNGGLDIILYLYPQAQASVLERKKKFKLREEKSASANLYQTKEDGVWLVTDFGGDSQPRNGILCWQLERSVDYVTAMREIAARFGILGQEKQEEKIRAEYSEQPADPDAEENKWTWETRGSFTDFEIETIVSKHVLKSKRWKSAIEEEAKEAYTSIAGKFRYYRWHSLLSYSLVKNGKKMTFAATDEYPIYLINEGSHQKLYQPKHPDKSKRFMYLGEKPKHFIHGLQQLEKLYNERKENQDFDEDYDSDDTDKKKKDPKLEEVIICSGGSDAINVALLGYQVLWLNSETEILQPWQYRGEKGLASKVDKIYQLQDIDATGKAAAHKLALEYLDVYTIELPEELKEKRDSRRNPCKDVRDYLNHYTAADFERVVKSALPYRFWERKPNYEGRGDKQVFVGWKYIYRTLQANNFLQKNGFGRLKIGNKESDWIYVHRKDNIVRQVDAGMIQDYLHEFLEKGYHDIELREAMLGTSKLNETSLSRLKMVDIDFSDYTTNTQFIFFKNKTVEVTPTEIKYHQPNAVDRCVWERDVHKHGIYKLDEPPFIITKDDLGVFDIEIKDTTCPFFKYLIQTSRIHWRKELEGERLNALTPIQRDEYKIKYHCCIDGPNLTAEEIAEQKQHLLNKLFVIGWHLHRYKDPTKGWFSWGMDGKMSEDGRSHGGSGKSLLFDRALRHMLPQNLFINARNPKNVESEFKYDGMNEHTRYVLFDDCHEYFKVEMFYVDTTGDVEVNPKGKTKFNIPFAQAPKFAFTSNFMPRDLSPSTERRILYYVVSDYYHNKGESDDYLEKRTPKTDLGLSLFTDFDQEQWNLFYNTMLQALRFFLSTEDIVKPAMDNVNRRNLLNTMGENFHEWAKAYFNQDSGRLDKFIVKEEAHHMFNRANKSDVSAQLFKKKLIAFCKFYSYIFNPKEYQNKQCNIVQRMETRVFKNNTWEVVPGSSNDSKEVIFIQTRPTLPADPRIGWPEEKDNLPF
ncbi:hypothetical protein KHS38_12040 [Mucilaginibacter sp. Bleaf8]|uniref:primase-helicase family protein n=1 Tax=Mucilaginibacter sp. Bleaf8 TaxID=2834430 RepID=UPI001BD0564C|nr:primase-helicase family protein [Mucilaginibacter sp. Bleaf8]MBS7565135.1 hypothetical protein [Mucilaginibacter sp. Bleaf8]